MALRAQLQPLRDHLETIRERAMQALPDLGDDALNWRPKPDMWSIALVLDHLTRSINLTLTEFDNALATAEPAGEEANREIRYRLLDRLLVRMLGPASRIKLPVPDMFVPKEFAHPAAEVVPAFCEAIDRYAALIEHSNGFRLGDLTVQSPAVAAMKSGYLPYMHAGVEHARYHWGQVEAILAHPEFPATSR